MPASLVYTVAEINQQVRTLLLENFSEVIVRGEISGLKQYASGHWYFTLKDPDSEIRCAMFRNRNQRVSFVPQDGDAIRVRARVDLYVQRGSYQLVIEDMEPEGRGELLRRLEELKAKLRDEGLFDPQQKQAPAPLPLDDRRNHLDRWRSVAGRGADPASAMANRPALRLPVKSPGRRGSGLAGRGPFPRFPG